MKRCDLREKWILAAADVGEWLERKEREEHRGEHIREQSPKVTGWENKRS